MVIPWRANSAQETKTASGLPARLLRPCHDSAAVRGTAASAHEVLKGIKVSLRTWARDLCMIFWLKILFDSASFLGN